MPHAHYGAVGRSSSPSSSSPSSASHSSPSSARAAATSTREPLLNEHKPQEQSSQAAMSLAERLYAYDLTLATLTYQRFGRWRPGRIAGEVLCHTDDGYLWLLTFPPIMGLLWLTGLMPDMSDDTKAFIKAIYVFMLVDIVGIMLLKLVFKRGRPPHHAADPRFIGPDQHSFPSGHATRAWGVVAFIVAIAESRPEMLVHVFRASAGVVVAVVVVWALAISFTRIALGRHYPSDVLAGSLIGYLVFYPIAAFISHSAGIL